MKLRRLAISAILFLSLIVSLSAQNMQFEATKTSGGGFNVTSGADLNETIMIENTSYDVFATAKGSKYIICNSPKTGNDYPVWIGNETQETYEGRPVRVSKKGTYFVLIKSKKTNNPYCKYLKVSQ